MTEAVSIASLAKCYGSPLYVYDADQLANNFRQLKNIFTEQVDVFYSIKANPNFTLCAELRQCGACAEVCSGIELETVLKAGFTPENIIFVGPAKTDEEIARCLAFNIYAIVCESKEEWRRIAILAEKNHQKARVALRINPAFSTKNALLKMGGQASQFGMDEDQIWSDKDFFLSTPAIHLMGIHIYNGTRILDPNVIIENTRNIFQLAIHLQHAWHVNFEMVDIGGGLGVPYFDNETALDTAQLATGIQPVINQFRDQHPNTRIILESGRFLVATAGIFVSQIVDSKISKGEYFLITNGGTNCHMAAVGVGGLIKRNFPISLLSLNHASTEKKVYNITGPLCTPGDLIGKQVLLPEAAIGDLILIHHSGAYGPTASPTLFLSHGFPNEVLVKNQQSYLIRKAQTAEDVLSMFAV